MHKGNSHSADSHSYGFYCYKTQKTGSNSIVGVNEDSQNISVEMLIYYCPLAGFALVGILVAEVREVLLKSRETTPYHY